MRTSLADVFKNMAFQKSLKDKQVSLERFKKPLETWRIEWSFAEKLLDKAFGKNSVTAVELLPFVKREFGNAQLGNRSIKQC